MAPRRSHPLADLSKGDLLEHRPVPTRRSTWNSSERGLLWNSCISCPILPRETGLRSRVESVRRLRRSPWNLLPLDLDRPGLRLPMQAAVPNIGLTEAYGLRRTACCDGADGCFEQNNDPFLNRDDCFALFLSHSGPGLSGRIFL